MNTPYITSNQRDTNIAEILWIMEQYGITMDELDEPTKAPVRPEEIEVA